MQTARFVVHETDNPQADVFVQKFQRDANNQGHSGENIAFVIVVGNVGPDAASAVHLVDSVPSGAAFVSFTQNSGPPCTPLNTSDCTIASMANGDRAEFTVVYNFSGGAGTYDTSATATGTTPDPNSGNNTGTTQFNIQSGASSGGCDLTCPSDISTSANTTEGGERGAHVNYPAVAGTGQCGSISSTPVSGSFFPVGTTVVTVSSETGGGSCQFSITVEESTGNTTVSCPPDKQANADSSCQATVNVGTATGTGDNVTISGSRSDGRPLSDPYTTGTTIITWTATSHDTPGPYATPEDEEAHRTGNASCIQTIVVNDVTPPVIQTAPQTASADANCQAIVPDFTATATVSDNCACDGDDNSEACSTRSKLTITQDPAPGTVVGLGPHTITLTANDGSSNNNGAGNTATVTTTFTVNDTTPPTFTFVPPAVVAYTGPNATSCDTVVTDATLGTATATDNCGAVTITRSPTGNTFTVGTTTITWTATDSANPANTATATQTVTVIDNTPPTITLNGQTPSLWPPNHKYRTFNVTNFVTSVFDNCDVITVADVTIDKVTSDEAENGNGSGDTLNDIVIAADKKSVQLRSEREGGGNDVCTRSRSS